MQKCTPSRRRDARVFFASPMIIAALALFNTLQLSLAEDWPQWMGSQRDGVCREEGLIKTIPDDGLKVVWRMPIATGYSGPAVSEGRVFVMDYVATAGKSTNNPDGRDQMQGRERVLAFDASTGKELWKVEYDRPYLLSYANGPRATPTVDGDRVYTLGAEGDLYCLNVADGKLLWKKQLAEEYGAESPIWGHAAHPLVHGDLIFCLAGGAGSVAVALNKMTGKEVWRNLTAAEIGYCPPSIHELGGKERLLIWDAEALHALDPTTGKEYWSYPIQPRYGMSITMPRLNGDLMYVCGIGETAAMIRLDKDGRPDETLWTGKPKMGLYCGNSTPHFVDDTIYGADCGTGEFIAVNAKDGSYAWKTFALTTGGERRASHGTAFIIRNENQYFVFAETGELILVSLNAEGYQEHGRTQILEPTGDCFGRSVVWSHPALANKKLYARNDKEIICLDVSE